MNIPEKLEVAGITYDIKEVPKDDPDLNHGHLTGPQYMVKQWIKLSKENKGDYKGQCFTHEFVHAICDALDISNCNIEINERFVESFSQLLYQVIKQL